MIADLSAFEGPPEVPLTARDDGSYELQQHVEVSGPNGLKTLPVFIEQNTFVGPHWVRLERTLMALPRDEALFGAGLAAPWQAVLDGGDAPEVALYEGAEAVALESPVEAILHPVQGVLPFGYRALRFRFHPGEARLLPRPNGAQARDILYVSQIFRDDIDIYGKSEVFGMRADGTQPINLSRDPGEESLVASDGPSWSPDGTRIVFTSRRIDADPEIYSMAADGSDPINLTHHPAFDASPSWSPDGTRIAFSSDRDAAQPFDEDPDNPSLFGIEGVLSESNFDIYAMDADGSNPVRLTDDPGLDHFPAWSPDGTKIAFTSSRDSDPETEGLNMEIYVMDADGSNPVRLTEAPGWNSQPAWSPDGNLSIFAMDADGSNQIQLTDGSRRAGSPAWSPVAGSAHLHFGVAVNGHIIRLVARDLADVGVDVERREWQTVEIPLAAFELEEPIEEVRFIGNLAGTAYLDDIRLVAVPPPATAVLEEHRAARPLSFALDQNYPNPFNSGTAIRFSLPSSAVVDLTLYNLAGQRVATLVEGRREAGIYTLRWDGRDDEGRELASGLYLYRLQAGTEVETRKLLLVR